MKKSRPAFFSSDDFRSPAETAPDPSAKNEPQRCALIIQPGAIGDVILTLPLVRLIRRHPRVAEVDIMGRLEYLSYLPSRTDVTHVISLDSVPLHSLFTDSDSYNISEDNPLSPFLNRYDLIVTFLTDPQGHFERNLIHITAMSRIADVVGLALKPPQDYPHHVSDYLMRQYLSQFPGMELAIEKDVTQIPMIVPTPADHRLGRELLCNLNINPDSPVIAMHPGSGGVHKCWPLDNYRTLADKLQKNGRQPLFLWGPAEQDRWGTEKLNCLTHNGQFPVISGVTIEQIAGALVCCAAYVGNDSGISHLAGALGLPCVVIFGPSEPTHWRPLGGKISLCRSPDALAGVWPTPNTVYDQIEYFRTFFC